MKNTLDGIVNKAKNAFGKTRNLASKLSYPLALAGALSFSSPAVPETKGEVEFSIQTTSSLMFPSKVYTPQQECVVLQVYADNTTEPNATSGLEWKVEIPEGIHFASAYAHNPYFINQLTKEVQDWFSPYAITTNLVAPNKNLTINRRFVVNGGPEKTKGMVGMYFCFLFEGAPVGSTKKFRIYDTKAYDINGQPQPTKDAEYEILIIPSYDIFKEKPLIIQTLKNNEIIIDVTESDKPTAIEASTDLSDWTEIFRNTNYSSYDNLYMPYNFKDTQIYSPNRFYKVKPLELPLSQTNIKKTLFSPSRRSYSREESLNKIAPTKK